MKRFIRGNLGIRVIALFLICCLSSSVFAVEADLIVYNGKIVTVDSQSSICRAMAVKGIRILHIGGNKEILQLKGGDTKVLDLNGKMVMPGFIDSHVHPAGACMTEFDHPIPQMDSIVLDTDLLTCPVDDIRNAKVLSTYMDGRCVFKR